MVLVSQAGDVLVSADGGRSFRAVPRARSAPASSVAATRADAVVIAGVDGLRVEALRPGEARP